MIFYFLVIKKTFVIWGDGGGSLATIFFIEKRTQNNWLYKRAEDAYIRWQPNK